MVHPWVAFLVQYLTRWAMAPWRSSARALENSQSRANMVIYPTFARAKAQQRPQNFYYTFVLNQVELQRPVHKAKKKTSHPYRRRTDRMANTKINAKNGIELRQHPRHRVHLRSAILANFQGRILCDCIIHDRSRTGLCVRLMAQAPLPLTFAICEEETETITAVRLVWREDKNIGLCFQSHAALSEQTILNGLKKRIRKGFAGPQGQPQ